MHDDQQLDDRARAALEQRLAALDGATLSRLSQARAHALQHGLRRRHHWLTVWLPAAGAFAMAALVAVNVWYVQPDEFVAPEPALLEELALEETSPPVDDLEFLDWLAGNGNGAA
jgi:hypothetical protein